MVFGDDECDVTECVKADFSSVKYILISLHYCLVVVFVGCCFFFSLVSPILFSL